MAEQKIELRKIRDFGENMNDTFLFIRQNFLPLIRSFLAICAIFMLAQAILTGLFQYRAMGLMKEFLGGRRVNPSLFFKWFLEYLLIVLSALLTIVSVSVVLAAYIKYYLQSNGAPPLIEDIWTIFKKYFLKVLIYSLPVYFIIIIGCLFCLVPGIYLWVVLTPFSLVVVLEGKNFSDSFGRCFDLIRENFWASFAIYLVSYIIYVICGLLISALISAIFWLAGYLTTEDLNNSYAFVSSFLNVFSSCFYIIFFVSAALNYFHLVEVKDGTGILNRIDTIGMKKNNFNDRKEEY